MAKKKPVNRSIDVKTLDFQIRESYKLARTNIAYSIIKKGCKKIAFTSSVKGEGKTLTAVNVASALAQQMDTRVIVVECDLRRPRIQAALNAVPTPGLTNYLNDECSVEDIIKETRIPYLKAVCYGAIPPNPSELLASEAMSDFIKKLEQDYDYIIFDTPPLGVVVDAVSILKQSDGVVVVAKNNATTYPQLNKTLEIIKRAKVKTLGVIINKVKPTESKKGYNYGYY